MSQTKIAIVEDELIIADDLKAILEDIGYICPQPCCSYPDAIEMLEKEMPDLVMLDIFLFGKPDGIDLARYIRKNFNIPFLFLTANSDEATLQMAKETRPQAYLVKPFKKASIHTAVEVALHNFSYEKKGLPLPKKNPLQDTIFIKTGDCFNKLAFDEVLYMYSEGVYVVVCTPTKKMMVRAALQAYIENIDPLTFVRVHKSYAVNIKKISRITPDSVTIETVEVPLSRQYRQQLLTLLNLG